MMKLKAEKLPSIIILIVGIIFSVYIVIKGNKYSREWNDPTMVKGKESGIIVEYIGGARTAPKWLYEFEFNNSKYSGELWIPEEIYKDKSISPKKYIGKEILIEFIRSNPDNNRCITHDFNALLKENG